ncbi:MAG: hypothetical protein V9G22_17120 [Ottowia sp.]
MNIAGSTALVLMLAHGLWRHGATRGWTVLLVAIAALGVMLTDLPSASGGAIGTSWAQLLFTPILFVLWLTLTRRVVGARRPRLGTAGWRRWSASNWRRSLHDGVGSQLTTIISALDHGSPQERATAAALQEALIDLKLLVDGVDEEASVVSLLANLRYRTRPLLEAAGIEHGLARRRRGPAGAGAGARRRARSCALPRKAWPTWCTTRVATRSHGDPVPHEGTGRAVAGNRATTGSGIAPRRARRPPRTRRPLPAGRHGRAARACPACGGARGSWAASSTSTACRARARG